MLPAETHRGLAVAVTGQQARRARGQRAGRGVEEGASRGRCA